MKIRARNFNFPTNFMLFLFEGLYWYYIAWNVIVIFIFKNTNKMENTVVYDLIFTISLNVSLHFFIIFISSFQRKGDQFRLSFEISNSLLLARMERYIQNTSTTPYSYKFHFE